MGNRAHARIDTSYGPSIFVYTHWDGPEALYEALSWAVKTDIAQERAGDPEYFIRIVLHKVLNKLADADQSTGFGVSTWASDGDLCAVVNADTGTIERA